MTPSVSRIVLFSFLAFLPSSQAKSIAIDRADVAIDAQAGQEMVEHDFVLENTGNAPVLIAHVVTSCGCTQYQLSKNLLAPRETARLKLSVKLEGKTGTMPISAQIYFEGDAPAETMKETVRLSIKVPERLLVRPRIVTWDSRGKPEPKRVLLEKRPSALPFSIVGVESKDSGFDAKLLPADGGNLWLEITPKDTSVSGGAVYRIVLEPSAANQNPVTVYAYVR